MPAANGRRRIGFDVRPGNSGPGRYVAALASALDAAEFEPVFIETRAATPAASRGAAAQPVACGSRSGRCRRATALVGRAVVPRFVPLWTGFACQTRRLASLLRGGVIDLFHSQNTGCEEWPVAARLARVPQVLGTFHVDSTYDLGRVRSGFRHRAIECLSNRCLHRAIAVSAATKREWVRRTGLTSDRVAVIHNGIDPSQFRRRSDTGDARRRLGLPVDGPLIGGVGRLDPAKGFSDLLTAVARLSALYPRLTLVLAGEGPLRSALQEQATRLEITGRVRFLGFCADVQQVYDALDVFVMPSLCEALPYALLEAMGTELPAVASRVGGVPEVIIPGETGLLAPPRDPDALAVALRALLDSPQLRRRMGCFARERVVRHFNERDMVHRTIQLYREHLSPQAESGPGAAR